MKNILLSGILFFFFINYAFSQVYKADRPHQIITGEIIPEKTFAVESGISALIMDKNNYSFNYNTTHLRLGMMPLMEMTASFSIPAIYFKPTKYHNAGIASPRIGAKIYMKQKSEDSKSSLIFFFDASVNIGTNDFKDSKVLPQFRVAMDIDVNERTNLILNYGLRWLENQAIIDEEDNPAIDHFLVAGGMISNEVKEKLKLFAEFIAQVKHNDLKQDYRINGGFIYNLKDNIQIDFSAGAGLSPNSSRGNINIGFAGLWPKKNIPNLE